MWVYKTLYRPYRQWNGVGGMYDIFYQMCTFLGDGISESDQFRFRVGTVSWPFWDQHAVRPLITGRWLGANTYLASRPATRSWACIWSVLGSSNIAVRSQWVPSAGNMLYVKKYQGDSRNNIILPYLVMIHSTSRCFNRTLLHVLTPFEFWATLCYIWHLH